MWSKRYFIGAVSLACGLIAFAASFVIPKTYQSAVVLKVGMVSYAASKGTGYEITTEYIESTRTVKDQIESEPFMAQVISRLNLDVTPEDLLKQVKVEIATDTLKYEENRLVNVTAEGRSPDKVVQLLDAITALVMERHKALYDQAMEVQFRYEEDVKQAIPKVESEIADIKATLESLRGKPGVDAPAVILLQAGIEGREQTLALMYKELRLVQSLTRTSVKSDETRAVLPPFTPTEPVSPRPPLNALAGLFVGAVLAGFYTFARAYAEANKE